VKLPNARSPVATNGQSSTTAGDPPSKRTRAEHRLRVGPFSCSFGEPVVAKSTDADGVFLAFVGLHGGA